MKKSNARIFLILIGFLFHLSSNAQSRNQLIGTWNGQMRSNSGLVYNFRLEIKNKQEILDKSIEFAKGCHLFATASHTRSGERQTFTLQGQQFRDFSVYLYEFPEDRRNANAGEGRFNRLQFEFMLENGIPTLIGYWQEYQSIRKYRKGRLVLTKLKVGT